MKNFAKHVQFIIDTEADISIRDKYLYISRNIPIAIKKCMREFIGSNPEREYN